MTYKWYNNINTKRGDYTLDDTKVQKSHNLIHKTYEDVLKNLLKDYLYKVHKYNLDDILDLQDRVHNVTFKHFKVLQYAQDNKTQYFFKEELIFVIYFDNMCWISETYY